MGNLIKRFSTKFILRFFAVLDVLFSDKFEMTVWDKDGRQRSLTRFCKSEIEDCYRGNEKAFPSKMIDLLQKAIDDIGPDANHYWKGVREGYVTSRNHIKQLWFGNSKK
jgi:hypothetical protein